MIVQRMTIQMGIRMTEINIDTDMEVNVRNKETAVVDKEKDFDTDVYNDDMVVEVIGKRKRNEHEGTSEKMIGLEDAESRVVPIKKVTGFPSKSRRTYMYPQSKQAKIALKRGDFIEFDNDGQVMKATVINREKASDKFYNYFNMECDDGVTRNIDGERVRLKKLEEEECNMVLIPSD